MKITLFKLAIAVMAILLLTVIVCGISAHLHDIKLLEISRTAVAIELALLVILDIICVFEGVKK